jgi:hypothetical protein
MLSPNYHNNNPSFGVTPPIRNHSSIDNIASIVQPSLLPCSKTDAVSSAFGLLYPRCNFPMFHLRARCLGPSMLAIQLVGRKPAGGNARGTVPGPFPAAPPACHREQRSIPKKLRRRPVGTPLALALATASAPPCVVRLPRCLSGFARAYPPRPRASSSAARKPPTEEVSR